MDLLLSQQHTFFCLCRLKTIVCRDTSSTLLAWGFWRVLLDEAQLVAHTSSVAAQKASSLWRRHAWTVTGTPLSHRLSELKVLFAHVQLDMRAFGSQLHPMLSLKSDAESVCLVFPSFGHGSLLIHE